MKKMYLRISALLVMFFGLGLTSCEDYLDKAPEASITEKEVFVNFTNYQGFVEELYSCMPDMSRATWTSEWNWGDDILQTTTATFRLSSEFDNGNYRAWYINGWSNSWLTEDKANTHPGEPYTKGLWPLCWYGIRKANLGLANLELMVDATQEERNTIEGQLLYFRGWFHMELMMHWGGLAYVDNLLSSSEKYTLPRLSYRETALKAAEDFEAAAKLLPADWDKSPVGAATLNNNNQRITKSAAYAYLGKDLLYAASPMMNESSGGPNAYDEELCKRAAAAFAEVFKLSESGAADYAMLPFDKYYENWYSLKGNGTVPGYPEVLVSPPSYAAWTSRWSVVCQWVPPFIGGDKNMQVPAANYVNYYGMANGLPIDDPASGYDPKHPWNNRDPRFYNDVTYDGCKIILGDASADMEQYRYAELFNGGKYRSELNASRTGYMLKKFLPNGSNNVDNAWNNHNFVMPYLRLADVYLMYAESVLNGYGSATATVDGYSLTAAQAVNVVRTRAGVPDVASKFLGNKTSFMDVIMRERAVELSFEGHRWHDIRRWNVAGQKQYTEKTAVDFDTADDGSILNLKERLITTRVYQEKHKWLPFQDSEVTLYPAFQQNPGW